MKVSSTGNNVGASGKSEHRHNVWCHPSKPGTGSQQANVNDSLEELGTKNVKAKPFLPPAIGSQGDEPIRVFATALLCALEIDAASSVSRQAE